jgi:hypothetical protein
MDPKAWFQTAERKLAVAESDYARRDYGSAISALQGAEERIAKGLLLRLSILPDDPGPAASLKRAVGVKYLTPKALGHDWHVQLLDDLDPFLNTFEAVGTSFGNRRPGWRVTKFWGLNAPDYRRRVEAAKRVKSTPAPNAEELDGVLKDCNRFLDQAAETASKMKPIKVKIPKASQVDRAAKASLKRAGVYAPRELRKEIEEELLTKFKSDADRVVRNIPETVILVHILLTMAALNVYLHRHHVLGEYPTSEVRYDEAFPLVAKFSELRALLLRGLDMAKVHSAAIAAAEGQKRA